MPKKTKPEVAETAELSQRKIDSKKSKKSDQLVLSDDAIIVIRELLQLSLLTNTSIVDRLRTFVMEGKNGKLVPSDSYIEAYNAMVSELEAACNNLASQEEESL